MFRSEGRDRRDYRDSDRRDDRRDQRDDRDSRSHRGSTSDSRREEYSRLGSSTRSYSRPESFSGGRDRRDDRSTRSSSSYRDDRRQNDRKSTHDNRSSLQSSSKTTTSKEIIDPTKTCPTSIRFFIKAHGRFDTKEFQDPDNLPPTEVQLNLWRDYTLRRISDLIRAQRTELKRSSLHFQIIYSEPRTGAWRYRDVGNVAPVKPGPDDGKTLDDIHYHSGDYFAVTIAIKTDNRHKINNNSNQGHAHGRSHNFARSGDSRREDRRDDRRDADRRD